MTGFVNRCRICNRPLSKDKYGREPKVCAGINSPCVKEMARRKKRLWWDTHGHNGEVKAA